MRFSVSVPALFRLALASTGFSVACFDGQGTDPPPTLHIGIEPRRATVSQGDSSEIVAVVSANFKLVNEPQVFVSGAPAGVDVRVSRVNQATTLASVGLQVVVALTAVPGTYGIQLHATNAARESPPISFDLTVALRPDCSQAAPCIQWAVSATASSQYSSDAWSAAQATGMPNVRGCSDNIDAWASVEPNTLEWLEVQFNEAMVPAGVQIHENYGASSIVSIELKDEQGVWHTVFTATPGRLTCPSVRAIPVTTVTGKVKVVRLNIDQRTLNDWNEVDAVGLLGYRVK